MRTHYPLHWAANDAKMLSFLSLNQIMSNICKLCDLDINRDGVSRRVTFEPHSQCAGIWRPLGSVKRLNGSKRIQASHSFYH